MSDKKKEKEMPVDPKMEDQEDDEIPEHEVESAAHDLLRAEKHKENEKLMKKVNAHLSGKKKAIESIQDLKDLRNEMAKK